MKSKLIMMVGLQGSGKSTLVPDLAEKYNAVILSSDNIRKEHGYAIKNEQVFKLLYASAKIFLRDGKNVILDATNTTIKSRRQAIQPLKATGCEFIAYVMCTPYKWCAERLTIRNEKTEFKVPLEALERYYHNYQIPFYEEGFSNIIFVGWEFPIEFSDGRLTDMYEIMDGFEQHNKHHKYTVGKHCELCAEYISKKKPFNQTLVNAARLHDIGKLHTQTFEEDGQAHYYNHANVGTYRLLANLDIIQGLCKEVVLDCLFYINYHMFPHTWTDNKTHEKYKRLFGKTKYDNLILLNHADKIASGGAHG